MLLNRCCSFLVLLLCFSSISTKTLAFQIGDASVSSIGSSPRSRRFVFTDVDAQRSIRIGPVVALFASTPSSSSSSSSVSTTSAAAKQQLDKDQLTFVLGYLNKHHGNLLKKFAEAFSSLGADMAKANAMSGGSFLIDAARITNIDTQQVELQVDVLRRGKQRQTETVQFALNSNPVGQRRRYYDTTAVDVPEDPDRLVIDDICRRLCRLCWIVKQPEVTGKLLQLAIQLSGSGIGKLPENMYLNQVPHNRYVRQYFYDSASAAVLQAVIQCSEGNLTNRMKVISQFPEMNPSMDSYRIGTILEMVRAIAITLAEENLRVRVCVQGSMGVGIFTGVPKQLNGVSKLMQMMDWQSQEGEENEGMVGEYIRFGAVGPEHVINTEKDVNGTIVQHQDDVFIIIAPQSMVGTDSSIYPLLKGMVEKAGDRPVILINPDLTDKVSAAGQQSVRGRQERIDFDQSFEIVYQFQNTYVSGTSYFPILGATTKMKPSEPWIAHQRRDYAGNDGEIYVPVLAGETKPSGESIMAAFER